MCSIIATEQFMRAAGQQIPAAPTLPPAEVAELRVNLILEEAHELKEALAAGNLVEVLDALADLQVVLDGAVLACGMKGVIRPALAEVHRSNMSKFPSGIISARNTIASYAERGVEAVAVGQEGGGYTILRKSDNKVLKSIHYSPANLAPLLQ